MYFGVIWMALGMAPILVSGYYSPRHMYLASLGWAVAFGIALDILWTPRFSRHRWRRLATVVVAAVLPMLYGFSLHGVVRDWNARAAISRAAVVQIEHEARQSRGNRSSSPVSRRELGVRGAACGATAFHNNRSRRDACFVISDSFDHCCNAVLWNEYTRNALRSWHGSAGASARRRVVLGPPDRTAVARVGSRRSSAADAGRRY